jgi:hypothetical protein
MMDGQKLDRVAPDRDRGDVPARPEWIEALEQQGLDPRVTRSNHCWIRVHRWGRLRYPPNLVAPVSEDERRELFRDQRALIIAAHQEPWGRQAANAYVYLCRDRGYDVGKLSANNRSKARRGLRRYEVRPVTAEEILAKGYRCTADRLIRNGLRPPSLRSFQLRWQGMMPSPYLEFWGALAEGELAAYLVLRRCDRWVEIVSTGSANSHLKNYPNHALFVTVLTHLMTGEDVESVSYGISSVQLDSRADTLHSFKLSLGFEAVPVVRFVGVHPILRPLMNGITRMLLRAADRWRPGSLVVKKARALVEMLAGGETAPLPGSSGGSTP